MSDTKMWKFIVDSMRPFKWPIGVQVFICVAWSLDFVIRPYILKLIIDKIPGLSPENITQSLMGLISWYIGLGLFMVLVFRASDYSWLYLNSPMKRHISSILMERMLHHSQSLYHNNFAGALANKIKDVMSGVPDLIKLFLHDFLSTILAFSIAAFGFLSLGADFSLLFTFWIIAYVAICFIFFGRARRLSTAASEMATSVVGKMVDILGNFTSVLLFVGRITEQQNLKVNLDSYVKADQDRDFWFAWMNLAHGLSFVIYQVFFFWLALDKFEQGALTSGDLIFGITVNMAAVSNLWHVSRNILQFANLFGTLKQGLNIVLSPIEIKDKEDAKALQITEGRIRFENVQFHYPGCDPLFENKSVVIEPGQKVGLVGHSGGGKSTFVNLILRLYDIKRGGIFIDEQNIKDVTQDSLRQEIAFIPQDPSLFHRTLLENIRYSKPDASGEDVIVAAQNAHAHDFICRLPAKYDSLVGERGVKLSGGQRQRIAIARAFLKNAPILILDEATSQLDSVTEAEIQESLIRLMQGKTTIVIAHRLSTLLHMDRILVFDKGHIVEDGTHDELLAKGSIYTTLWSKQVGGFLQD